MRHRSGEGAPGRLWGKCPRSEGAKRRQALMRNAAPGGLPCGKARPFSGREQPAHNADRRAYRRLAAAFFLRPRDRLLKRTGAPIRYALDSADFHPRSSVPISPSERTHVVEPGGVSRSPRRLDWLGRTRRRRIPPRSHAPHENALGGWDRDMKHHVVEQIKNIK